MFFANDPGPWQYYVNRKDNVGLPLEAVRRKYLTESIAFEEQMSQWAMQSQNYANASGGTAAPVPSLPPNCIEFVANTTEGVNFNFNFTTSGPTDFTLTWGDGETLTDTVDGSYGASHTYAELNQSYTCTLCFDDISLVTELDFPGND